jgi:hypothetical protein
MWETWVVSFLSGGLAGGSISALLNRWFHWRDLRTRFYPIINDIFVTYMIRVEKPAGRYLVGVVGAEPSKSERPFIDHRADFLQELIQFNELKEARVVRKAILDNSMADGHSIEGNLYKTDLMPEYEALRKCHSTVHKKLKLD